MADVKLLLQADVLKWDNLSAKDMLENLKLAKIRANNRLNTIIFISFNIILRHQHFRIYFSRAKQEKKKHLHICTDLPPL